MSDRIDEARRRIATAISETDNSDHARGLSHADRILRSLPEAADERWEKLRAEVVGMIDALKDHPTQGIRRGYQNLLVVMDRLSPPAERSDEERAVADIAKWFCELPLTTMWSELEKRHADLKAACDGLPPVSVCRVVTARIKLRNDNGPSGELSEPKEFVCVDGEYYEKDWIRSAPGVRAEQLEF